VELVLLLFDLALVIAAYAIVDATLNDAVSTDVAQLRLVLRAYLAGGHNRVRWLARVRYPGDPSLVALAERARLS